MSTFPLGRAALVTAFAVSLSVAAASTVFAQAGPATNTASAAAAGGNRNGGGGRNRAAQPSAPPAPAPRTPDGKPDFSGVWDGGGGSINKDIPDKKLPYTPAGEAAYQYNLTKAIDPQSLCIIIGQPRADVDNRPFEVVQSQNRVAFLYERDVAWRVVRVDGPPHPADPEPSFFGDAVGKWDGDTLVVDVVALKGERVWADNVGHPHSDAAHLTERWSRPDADHLQLVLTIDDPKYYTTPITFNRTLRRTNYVSVDEEACDENNVDRDHLGPGLGTKDGNRGFDRNLPQPANAPAAQ